MASSGLTLLPKREPSLPLRTTATHALTNCQIHIQARQNANDTVDGDEHPEPFGALAKEFGVETQLVHALAQRLAAFQNSID
jgi:hypothetical protein